MHVWRKRKGGRGRETHTDASTNTLSLELPIQAFPTPHGDTSQPCKGSLVTNLRI